MDGPLRLTVFAVSRTRLCTVFAFSPVILRPIRTVLGCARTRTRTPSRTQKPKKNKVLSRQTNQEDWIVPSSKLHSSFQKANLPRLWGDGPARAGLFDGRKAPFCSHQQTTSPDFPQRRNNKEPMLESRFGVCDTHTVSGAKKAWCLLCGLFCFAWLWPIWRSLVLLLLLLRSPCIDTQRLHLYQLMHLDTLCLVFFLHL